MSSKTIVCAACNAPVPYGRLSCPSCGELLASVAGSARPLAVAAVAMRATPAPRAARATPSILMDVPSAPETAGRSEPASDEIAVGQLEFAELATAELTTAQPEGVEDHLDIAAFTDVQPATDAPAAVADVEPAADFLPPPVDDKPQWPESRPSTPSAAMAASPYLADAPGAYVPPVLPATPAGPPALARAWAGHPVGDEAAIENGTSARASAAALMDGARLPEFIGWLAVAGSAMAAVGFMLPWGVSVIGASGVDYFDRWGLAGPFHPLVAIALLGLLTLSMVRNPVPLWIRVGLPGLGLGALLLGLIWPYLVGLPGMGPGVLVVGLGASILAVAGIVALATDRHPAEDRAA